jgi:hypothetical protein
LKDNRKIKALEENLLKQKRRSPTKKREDDDDVDDSRLIFILDSTIKAENKRKSR